MTGTSDAQFSSDGFTSFVTNIVSVFNDMSVRTDGVEIGELKRRVDNLEKG